jgi:hypothetical protein
MAQQIIPMEMHPNLVFPQPLVTLDEGGSLELILHRNGGLILTCQLHLLQVLMFQPLVV